MKSVAKMRGSLALITMVAVFALQSEANDDDQDTIDYRQHIMKAMDAQTAALGLILTEMVSDDNFVSHLDVIAINAQMALSNFEKPVEGGEALPKVWEDWDDFATKTNTFSDEITITAQIARENGREAAMGKMMDALSYCKECHDVYREKN